MNRIIKSCLDQDYNSVEKFLNLNKGIFIPEKIADLIISNSIFNDDIEMLNILLNNNIKFSDKILDYLISCSEDIFFILSNYIQKGNVDFVIEDKFDILFDLAKSKSATYKMFEYILKKTHISPYILNDKGGRYYHTIAEYGNNGILPYLIKNHSIDIFEKDDTGNSVFEYAIKSSNFILFNEVTTFY